ncbi:small, acid-soluble spore protein, gamma-type [Schinkia azotoformans MEV2011]|uniref:Small, acid-soluble spore protein gamma-type n=2 Tax=Schinkia azotoformans TaxID=1454 RepID=K6C0M2_SCHAZ|nr:gamma-type small acid-soluble spore protein [Schinkia azotoformans]EKN64710.1 small, acid-soluble spore protein B [Schinkia azotoformans LMG 9581]KEF39280.1 small, acid-soluble spore protein, gamma-type [Schinkia azotoformans MEV2011]MEC1639879.1 gamma-type small acid-soluble spore protein [Schinkia azotoformans]MEC1694966.1 gamma-type small acid-soluble spore protein [Schinkia azotoformans]MEC1716164.1 gamma-type small acid-soluble spore protein [Schinkia azotoformans]
MAKRNSFSGTNIQNVKQQNAQSAGAGANAGQFGTEFGSETDVQQVREQNAQSQRNKNQSVTDVTE